MYKTSFEDLLVFEGVPNYGAEIKLRDVNVTLLISAANMATSSTSSCTIITAKVKSQMFMYQEFAVAHINPCCIANSSSITKAAPA